MSRGALLNPNAPTTRVLIEHLETRDVPRDAVGGDRGPDGVPRLCPNAVGGEGERDEAGVGLEGRHHLRRPKVPDAARVQIEPAQGGVPLQGPGEATTLSPTYFQQL